MFCVLLCDGQSGVATRGDKRLRKTKVCYIRGVLERESPHATQGHRGITRFESGGRTEEQGESLVQSLHWNFCRKGKAGQNQHLRSGFLISPVDFGLYGVVSS